MLYEFECPVHGRFEVNQSIFEEHKAVCPICGIECQRLYSILEWVWAGSVYREDGSLREDKDYAPVMKG